MNQKLISASESTVLGSLIYSQQVERNLCCERRIIEVKELVETSAWEYPAA